MIPSSKSLYWTRQLSPPLNGGLEAVSILLQYYMYMFSIVVLYMSSILPVVLKNTCMCTFDLALVSHVWKCFKKLNICDKKFFYQPVGSQNA